MLSPRTPFWAKQFSSCTLGSIFNKYDITFHCFADEMQIYLPFRTDKCAKPMSQSLNCLEDIKQRTSMNLFTLNDSNTEILLFGDPKLWNSIVSPFGHCSDFIKPCVKHLGVFIDGSFKFHTEVSAEVQSGLYHHRLLAKVKPYLPKKVMDYHVIHLFVSCRLDYCNSLYLGLEPFLPASSSDVSDCSGTLVDSY